MKIKIGSETLEDELFKLQGVVSQRSTLAILSNTLLEAEDGRHHHRAAGQRRERLADHAHRVQVEGRRSAAGRLR